MVQVRSNEGEEEVNGQSESDTVVIVDDLEIPSQLYRRAVADTGHDEIDEWIAEAIRRRLNAEDADVEPSRYGEGDYGKGEYGSDEEGE